MKKFTKVFVVLVAALIAFTAIGCKKDEGIKITVWVSETEGVKELTQQQIAAFNEANPNMKIEATVEGVSESNSATQMITDVETGADLFCFAQDQLVRLVQAGALAKLGTAASEEVKANNDAGSVAAASINGELYCYPLTSDNGYYMYYDSSVVQASHIDSLEDIIADCKAANKYFAMELETSAWYNASFFFATGCVSEWTTDEDGSGFKSVNDTFNSDKGVIALKGMQKLYASGIFTSSSDASALTAATPAAVLISGTWASAAVKDALGDNYAAADLPSFTVDGKSYHLGSFSGNKLMGMKPQTDSDKAAAIQKLALYLTNEQCQLARFEKVGWGPSNVKAQQNQAVQADPALKALAAQSAYATPQGQIHGSWWDLAKSYCTDLKTAVEAGDTITDEMLKGYLQNYADNIAALFTMTAEEKDAFTIIGTVNAEDGFFYTDYQDEKRANWNYDVPMTLFGDGKWRSDYFWMPQGAEFKVRQGKSWDVAFGYDAVAAEDTNFTNREGNAVVAKAGFYRVVFSYKDGVASLAIEGTFYNLAGTMNEWGKITEADMMVTKDGITWVVERELAADDEFKVQKDNAWGTNYGLNDGVATVDGNNIKVTEAGTYVITLVLGDTVQLTVVKK